MRHWLTHDDAGMRSTFIKRFEPSHWTVDFPRGSMACVVSHRDENRLTATANFGRKGDLVGLIFTTSDPAVHVAHRRHAVTDYSRCTLRFRWKSIGLARLEAINGPTLTIEGKDGDGADRSWYVRLWNYAVGDGEDALVELPFDELLAGFEITDESERIDVRNISRMFISLVPPGFIEKSAERFPSLTEGEVEISEIECLGSGSVIAINDGFVPEHEFRICTAYDDCYNLTPERVIDSLERLGHRGTIDHYVGMSHYPALGPDGLVNSTETLCRPAQRWHESFAAEAKARGFDIILSVSMELLEELCPEAWKQRAWDGTPARTGWMPPSTLLSPAVDQAVDYLERIARSFVEIALAAGLAPKLQVGEPWWWITAANGICLYDDASVTHWPSEHVRIRDVRNVTPEQVEILEAAGALLSAATARIVDAAKAVADDLQSHLLTYLPSILRRDAPELKRANMPVSWRAPAFDVLQLEDYEWVTDGLTASRFAALEIARERLGYEQGACHYLAGFVSAPEKVRDWDAIIGAANAARRLGYTEVFIWALPQVLRDGLTIFEGEPDVDAFRDIDFPIELGANAAVEPCFATTISTSPGGFESRNIEWQQARLRFDVGPGLRSVDDVQALLHFYRSMRGNALAFRFRDSTDYSSSGMTGAPSATDQMLGTGDGLRRRFELVKSYGDGEVRRITRPVASSLQVALGEQAANEWQLADGGVIEFATAPVAGTAVRAGFLFDVPVRFEEPTLRVSRKTHLAGQLVSVPLIEVREA